MAPRQPGAPRPIHALLDRLRTRQRARPRPASYKVLIPNALTMIGLCSGLTAIRFAFEGRFGAAAVAITVSACIDGLDGRIARLLKATSRFGAEFDSLADFLCFGVAPAFVLYLWTLQTAGGYGFVPSLMFAVCMALRLARFNATLDAPPSAHSGDYFTGVPAPAGAAIALVPLFIGLEGRAMGWTTLEHIARHPLFSTASLAGTAILLVSTLPVWSFKHFKPPRPAVVPLLLATGLYAALMVADPWAALAAAGLLYLGMLPFSLRSYRRRSAEHHAAGR
jgi:CDP-diacylglycerol--serine O-phosphatidyltransferase